MFLLDGLSVFNCLWPILAQNPTSQANFGNLPQPNQLISPVLSTSRSDASTHGLKSREVAYLPTQLLGGSAYRPCKRAPLLPQFFRRWKYQLHGTTTKSTFKPIVEHVSIRRVQNRSHKWKKCMFTYPNIALKFLQPSGNKIKIGAECLQLKI